MLRSLLAEKRDLLCAMPLHILPRHVLVIGPSVIERSNLFGWLRELNAKVGVKSINMLDLTVLWMPKEGKEKRYKTIEDIDVNGVTPFNEQFINSIFYKGSFQNKKETVEAVRGMVFSNSKQSIKMGLRALADRSETCSSLHSINIPTLIICGREDSVIPMKQSEYMHSVIKGSTLRIINHAGHVSNLEQPMEFNKHLLDFVTAMHTNDPTLTDKYDRTIKSAVVWDL